MSTAPQACPECLHLLELLADQAERERQLLADVARLEGLVKGLAERVAGQAELLARRAER